MTCERVDLGEGRAAIVCGVRRRPQRCSCGHAATLLCDWKVPGNPGGTCNAPICWSCSISPAPGKDLCPTHTAAYDEWKREREART